MIVQSEAIRELRDKDELKELALLYARGVNGRDINLLRKLYTSDATDDHPGHFCGRATEYLDWLEGMFPSMMYCRHHVSNHLLVVDGNIAEGELYTIAHNILSDGRGGFVEGIRLVRFQDQYRKEGRWRFSRRACEYGPRFNRPLTSGLDPARLAAEVGISDLKHPIFVGRLGGA